MNLKVNLIIGLVLLIKFAVLIEGSLPMKSKRVNRSGKQPQTTIARISVKDAIDAFKAQTIASKSAPDLNSATKIMDSKRNLARNKLILCAILYGSTYVTTKQLQQSIPSQIINVIRFSLASLCFLWDIISFRGNLEVIFVGMELGLWCAVGFIAQCASLKFSTASKAALFTSVGVIIPPLLDFMSSLFKRDKCATNTDASHDKVSSENSTFHRLLKSPYFSPILAILGASVIEWAGVEPPALADLLLLVPPFCFAMTFWRAEKRATRFPQHTKTITGIMLLTTSILSAALALFEGEFPVTFSQWQSLGSSLKSDGRWLPLLLFNGVICTGWTAVTEQQSLKVISAADTSVIYALEPVFAAIFAGFLLSEHLTLNTLWGTLLIVLACMLH